MSISKIPKRTVVHWPNLIGPTILFLFYFLTVHFLTHAPRHDGHGSLPCFSGFVDDLAMTVMSLLQCLEKCNAWRIPCVFKSKSNFMFHS